jgi:two-component system chemotaxis sensor kinase CheA
MAKDQYKYFRVEARELLEGLSQGVLELERGGRGKDLVGRILRFVHTLKGASRVVKQPGIAELAHSIEDVFAPLREEHGEVPQERINNVLGLLDEIASKVASLDPETTETNREKPHPVIEEFFATVRVEVEEVDTLLEGVSEASVQLTALRRDSQIAGRARQIAAILFENLAQRPRSEANGTVLTDPNIRARALADELGGYLERLDRDLVAGIDRVEAEFTQVRDRTSRLRLLPTGAIFPLLERAVRDAAQSLQKEVLFESFGGDIRLDAHVLAALRDALLHVVRNAVAHGIESQPERRAAGKTLQGHVELRVERRGNRAAFVCCDDGRGIDVEAIRRAAISRGLVAASDATALGLEEAVRIIMKGGITTAGSVDEVSGRGIGLDVVRETAARLKGQVNVRSETGKGTSLEICVPVSVSSMVALQVDAGGAIASIPLDAIRQTLRVRDSEIARSAEKDSIVYDGKVIPFLALTRALGEKTLGEWKRRSWSVVVLEASSEMAAVGVDRLLGATTIVVRPLPLLAAAEAVVAGASVDAEGNPQLVLDPKELVATACLGRASVPEAAPAKRPPVLVIDDSLTTRMLEQSILESAGYEVDLATSAEEALAKAREKRYGLFLVDVEMPGMDGFEFVSRTQADAVLRTIPAILVTSRNAVEDRRRGEQAGARAYIVKGEFDQGYLLERIREVMG